MMAAWRYLRRRASTTRSRWRWRSLATVFGLFWLVWILWTTLQQRHRRDEPGAVHADDAAARRGRRPAQRVGRQRW